MKLVTGNDLATGDVTWWTGDGWSRFVRDATDAGDKAETIAATEEAALRVNAPYVIDADASAEGPRPGHIKDRIRAVGPTVRLDLNLKLADPAAGSWII